MPVKGFDKIEYQSISSIERKYGRWDSDRRKFFLGISDKIPYLCDETGLEFEITWATFKAKKNKFFVVKKNILVNRQEFIINLLKDYCKTNSIMESCKNMGVSYACFNKALKKCGAQLWKPSLETSNDLRRKVYEDYSSGMPLNQIIEKYNTWWKRIKEIVHSYGGECKKAPNYVENIRHESFKEINTEESAYFLGLLVADGSIVKNSVCLSLQKEDSYIIESFRAFSVFNVDTGPFLKNISPKKKNHKWQSKFLVCSKEVCNNLERYGVEPKKDFTAKINLEEIDSSLWHHVLRGFFDGDGSISFATENLKRAIIQFTTASKDMKDCLLKILNEIDISPSIHYHKRSNGAYYIHIKAHEDVVKFFEYTYKDASIFMKRKFLKFAEELNMRESYTLNKTKDQKDGNFLGVDWVKTKKKYRVTYNSKRAGPLFETKEEAALFLNQHKLEHSRYKAPQDFNWVSYSELESLLSSSRIINDLNITLDDDLRQILEEKYQIKTTPNQ